MVDKNNQQNSKTSFKIGVALLVVACLLWLSVVVVPFLTVESTIKAGAVGILIVVGEIAFWLGAILTGKEFITRYRQQLDPRNWKQRK
jgi:hypothetical protein